MEKQLSNVCDQHANRFDCPDALVEYLPKFDEYGVIVHDGGKSVVTIEYCPWCGKRLPASMREKWFDELHALGMDADDENIPEKFKSDAWYNS